MNNALPPYVFLPTGLFLAKLIAHKEGEDRSKWVTDFAVQLVEGAGRDDFASSLINAAVIKQNAAMKRVRRSRAKSELISEGVKNPTRQQIEERLKEIYAEEEITQDAPNGNAGVDVSDAGNGAASKSPTSCDTLTADGDTREDSQAKHDGAAITRNETRHNDALEPSANLYGDAATREGADVSTTVSRNMRRVPQNEAPAHGFSGGRTAQGTMYRSPEAAAQSGKASALDSPPDKDGQSAKTRDPRDDSRGRYAPPSCSPDDGNNYDQDASISTDNTQPEGLTGPSHGGSVASLEARQGRAGANAPKGGRTSQSHSAPARSAGPAKHPHGEFGNVMLTDDEFAKLCGKCVDADELITELDQYIESQGKTRKYKNHYATLLNWSRRKAQEAKPKQSYMTSDDISKKNYEESKARLEAMFSKGRETA